MKKKVKVQPEPEAPPPILPVRLRVALDAVALKTGLRWEEGRASSKVESEFGIVLEGGFKVKFLLDTHAFSRAKQKANLLLALFLLIER